MVESDLEKKIFVVTLPSKLNANARITFVCEEIYAHAVTPFPKYDIEECYLIIAVSVESSLSVFY